ncbi:TraR/DksA family transcriptional regulator [Citrobacter koseri]
MPDYMDHIQERQTESLSRQINAARVKPCGAAALFCEECDAPIPEARRIAIPGVVFCVTCQQIAELKSKHYRGV